MQDAIEVYLNFGAFYNVSHYIDAFSRILWTDAGFHYAGEPISPPYPGPSFDDVIAAILAVGGEVFTGRFLEEEPLSSKVPRVIGLTSGGGEEQIGILSNATGAVAGEEGVDCDGDGVADIEPGDPIICSALSASLSE